MTRKKAVLYAMVSKTVEYEHDDELLDLKEEFEDEPVGMHIVNGDVGVLSHD